MGKNGRDSSWSSPWSMADFSVSVPLGNKTDQKLSSPILDLKHIHLDLENVSLDT